MYAIKRVMAFIDGENLVYRYQKMVEDGRQRDDFKLRELQHEKDIFIWHPEIVKPPLEWKYDLVRVTFYTSVIGNQEKIDEIRDRIKLFRFSTGPDSLGTHSVTPYVNKRGKNERESKGVDLKIALDVLSNVYRNNSDVVLLFSGDGDFLPVIKEVIRHGKQVFIAAFSSGLNKELPRYADQFWDLDKKFFK